MDLATVEAFIGLVFALVYVIAREDYTLRLAAKYLFLVCMVAATFQLWTEFTANTELLYIFWFALAITVTILLFDLISILPKAIQVITDMVKNFRGIRKRK